MDIHFLILLHILLYTICVCTAKICSILYIQLYRKENEHQLRNDPKLYAIVSLVMPFIAALTIFIPIEIIYWTLIFLFNL